MLVSGATLGTWPDGYIVGQTFAGIATASYPTIPGFVARFDDFGILGLPSGAPLASAASASRQPPGGERKEGPSRLEVPVGSLGWQLEDE